MFARLLAFVCLLSCTARIGNAEPSLARVATVGVYLQVDANASSLSLQTMRMEVRDIMTPTGLNLVWTNAPGTARVDKLVVVTMRGTCQAGAEGGVKFKDRSSLASTAVTDGKVLPFSWVDCGGLNQFLKSALVGQAPRAREEIYGRALGRLLAHELYHVLMQTESHTASGVSKASFSVGDLLAAYLPFQPDAIALFQTEQNAPALIAEAHPGEAAVGSDFSTDDALLGR
jgi:hypothetical protein